MHVSLILIVGLSVLVVVTGILYRRRLGALKSRDGSVLTDDMVRRIEEHGRVEAEEPLDWEEIRAEEERFWEESWDEPEEL